MSEWRTDDWRRNTQPSHLSSAHELSPDTEAPSDDRSDLSGYAPANVESRPTGVELEHFRVASLDEMAMRRFMTLKDGQYGSH